MIVAACWGWRGPSAQGEGISAVVTAGRRVGSFREKYSRSGNMGNGTRSVSVAGTLVSLSISSSTVRAVIADVSRDVLPISPWLYFFFSVSKFFFVEARRRSIRRQGSSAVQ
jgi:hypothetical protein